MGRKRNKRKKMGRKQSDYRRGNQPKIRSEVAQAAHFRNSGGAMGGGKKQRNRKERQNARQNLRSGKWETT